MWTRDHDRVVRVSRALRTGIVWVNPRHEGVGAPHSGVGRSGYGSVLSLSGVLDQAQASRPSRPCRGRSQSVGDGVSSCCGISEPFSTQGRVGGGHGVAWVLGNA
ncbi:aldehyde dehydrogenase family protein [Streptomyces sp. NPDC003635]